jgi:hypothetical protein
MLPETWSAKRHEASFSTLSVPLRAAISKGYGRAAGANCT